MKQFLTFRYSRYDLVRFFIYELVLISLLLRVVLLIKSFSGVDLSYFHLPVIFLLGLFFDLVNASYFLIPTCLYLWLVPDKLFRAKWHVYLLYGWVFINTFLLLFNSVSEWFFWEEFNTRYNFIAVDYLIYTTEVIGNIRQSYPIEWIVVGLLAMSVLIVFLSRKIIQNMPIGETIFVTRTKLFLGYAVLLVLFFFTVRHTYHRYSQNEYNNELAGNGLYELFAAYLNNELNYRQFYSTQADDKNKAILQSLLQTPDATFVSDFPLQRKIKHEGDEQRRNVVLICVESFSADFMHAFGNTQNITPYLDSLSEHSLFFTNLYATGTRTVRGLEALSIGTPPTPGQSIVRRPNNENLATIGSVFKDKGYECKFIYGGYSYFDNMGYYFANNGYEVVDRSGLRADEIDYENIWGVADENLFTLATKELDKSHQAGKNFYAHIMTTSNHRPFTYPDGRIDIPSHTSREGAVKYTDYAIGQFIKKAKNKAWFANTLFIIVADHCASSAGSTALPIPKYHIPMLWYNPTFVEAKKMNRMMSQIDMMPTLLGFLNFSYTSNFFGYDMNELEAGRERVFISTYQQIGYIKHDTLIVLNPQKKANAYLADYTRENATPVPMNARLLEEAITWYQSASDAFQQEKLKIESVKK